MTDLDARADWEARIHDRGDARRGAPAAALPDLPPPRDLRAEPGAGHVTLRWSPVDGAVGYLVLAGGAPDGPFAAVDHHGMDVLAQPSSPYVALVEDERARWWTVAAVAAAGSAGEPAPAVEGAALRPDGVPEVVAVVRADAPGRPMDRPWEPMIGSERLSHLLVEETTGGRPIGAELETALRRAHDELGVRGVRAHAVFSAETGAYREVDGEPVHDFAVVDEVYDRVLAAGLEPVVELGFMPRDLASDPGATVFEYGAIVSPPKDRDRWSALVADLVRHLLDRYGERVRGWDFEVWNEANLDVFWSADRETWMRFYDATVAAVRSVDDALRVGGPASAAAGWIEEFLEHAARTGAPIDFVSTHTYGSPPLDLRPALERHGFPDARILWTEWGVIPTHFAPVNDSVFSATFLLSGMRSAAGRVEALSYWVVSDHFEELGRPPRLLHGGFGLRSVGDLPKPRWHALAMLAALPAAEVPVELTGDGAGGLVQAWAGRDPDGGLAALLWSAVLDQRAADRAGEPSPLAAPLERRVRLVLEGLADGAVDVEVLRLAPGSGDLAAAAAAAGTGDWPADEAEWARLAEGAALPAHRERLAVADGRAELLVALPLPSAVLVRTRRAGAAS